MPEHETADRIALADRRASARMARVQSGRFLH
jgi:hypothetical protein